MGRHKIIETEEQRKARMAGNMQRYRIRHPERVKAMRKKNYNASKLKAMNLCGGARCVKCGCDEILFLEFNHKNGGGCKERKEYNGPIMDQIVYKKRRTNDLEIVCRVCNALEHLKRKDRESAKKFKIGWIQ